VLKPIWREFVAKETLDIEYRAAMEPQWLMSTWILTEKLSKITAQARKIQSGNSEINDFVLVLMYSSTLTLEAMIGWLSVGYLER
jgi:hypothetical protein